MLFDYKQNRCFVRRLCRAVSAIGGVVVCHHQPHGGISDFIWLCSSWQEMGEFKELMHSGGAVER